MLQVEAISKTYSNGVKALNEINLTIEQGIFGLLGPNGAGKSSLMRTLATLQPADSGRILLDDVDLLNDPDVARSKIGYLPQDFGLYPNVSALELLDQFALFKGFTHKQERRDVVNEHLKMVNLQQHGEKKLGGFSGGMRQRFGIAQALLGSPSLLIVDEPTAGLDPAERLRLQSLLAELSENRVVLLSTHLVEDVLALCPKIAVMNQGSVVCQGSPEALMAELDGKVWMSNQSAHADVNLKTAVISKKMARGKQQVRVLSESAPGEAFSVVPVEFDDVYFTVLKNADSPLASLPLPESAHSHSNNLA